MSGHSKWSTIKRKKEKTDNARAKVFTKIGREIAVAVKEGGPDPAGNSKLKDVIAKAKAANVPNDNIDRIIKKAAGEGSADTYEEIIYEGYGPNGVAVVVEALTDNRNRTAGDVRHYFDKYGGNMGQSGSVMFMFTRQGVVRVNNEDEDIDEDKMIKAQKKNEAIILSMTRMERRNPDILNASRKRRIAAGSGTTVQEVNLLLKQFEQAKSMMKTMMGGMKKGGKMMRKMPFGGKLPM